MGLSRALPRFMLSVLLLFAAIVLDASPKVFAADDPVADFFRGKTVNMYVGAEAGAGFDLYARALGRHMGSHISGSPAVLPENMPGASSLILGNYLAKIAPRDGSAIGVVSPLLLFEPLFAGSRSKAQFRGPEMTMLGNGAIAHWVLLARHAAAIRSMTDLKYRDLVVGTTAQPGAAYILTHAIKKIFDLNHLKIVSGYGGVREITGAVDRGEISGCVMDLEDVMVMRPQWLRDRTVEIVAELSSRELPRASDRAPSIMELVANDEDKRVLDAILAGTTLSRPLIAPPQLPVVRTKALRTAFLATLSDPAFIAEMTKMKIVPAPTSGERMQKIIDAAYDEPSEVLARLRAILAE